MTDTPPTYEPYPGKYCLGEGHAWLTADSATTVDGCAAACTNYAGTPCKAFDMKVHDDGSYSQCYLHSFTSFGATPDTWDGFSFTCWLGLPNDAKQLCAEKCAATADCKLFTYRESDQACWLERATARYCSEGWASTDGKDTYAIIPSGPYVSNSCTRTCAGAEAAALINQSASGLITASLDPYPFTQYQWRLRVWQSGAERCAPLSGPDLAPISPRPRRQGLPAPISQLQAGPAVVAQFLLWPVYRPAGLWACSPMVQLSR